MEPEIGSWNAAASLYSSITLLGSILSLVMYWTIYSYMFYFFYSCVFIPSILQYFIEVFTILVDLYWILISSMFLLFMIFCLNLIFFNNSIRFNITRSHVLNHLIYVLLFHILSNYVLILLLFNISIEVFTILVGLNWILLSSMFLLFIIFSFI